jgi:RHS repeat-associated protein
VTQFSYNVLGERTQTTDPRSLNTTYTRDTRGLLTTSTSPDAGTVSHKYDKGGNLRFSQDANQAAAGAVYFTNYDFAGRPLTSGIGAATFSSLDPDAPPTSLETSSGTWRVVRQYDVRPSTAGTPWNHFATQINGLTLNNVAGRLAAVASQSSIVAWQVTLFSYDGDGRIAARYIFTEGNTGTLLTAINTTVTYTRDLRDAITQRATTVGASSFYQWYDYDGRGLLWKAYDSTLNVKPTVPDVIDTYRPSGLPQDYLFKRTSGTAAAVPIRYTIREQVQKIGDPATATYPFSARYVYQLNGVVDTAEFYNRGLTSNQRYRYVFGPAGYDALNRLVRADYWSWNGTSWVATDAFDLTGITYDLSGNLQTLRRKNQTGARIDSLTYNYLAGTNRLGSLTELQGGTTETWDAEGGNFTYDANGNVTTAPGPYLITGATYDAANLPLSITRNPGTSTTSYYRYDDAGQRITKQVGVGNTEVYLRDGSSVLGVFTMTGSTVASSYFNLLWNDRVVGRRVGNTLTYYHFDPLGSVRAVTSGVDAAVTESRDFDPWGLLMPTRALVSAQPAKEKFSGKEQDTETGLDYFGARYYMPALGRWAAVDPVASSMPEWSPYNYVYDNPVGQTDPDGRCPPPKTKTNAICFSVFIKQAEILGGRYTGDNRDYSATDPASRMYVVMDPVNLIVTDYNIAVSCKSSGECAGPSAESKVVVTFVPDIGTVTVNYHLENGFENGPASDGTVNFAPSTNGSYTAAGDRDDFPAAEAFHWKNGTATPLFRHSGSMSSLGAMKAFGGPLFPHDKWGHLPKQYKKPPYFGDPPPATHEDARTKERREDEL